MCGIAGIVGRRAANAGAVRHMAGAMAHRGPDDEGLWTGADGRVVLGHRRLSIIDLGEGGHQPMARGARVLTYNGEIYNYLELRDRLAAEGAAFRTASDTEVLLAAYEAWGPACLAELNGMFAFAIYDGETRSLFCARDRYGEKPFLFHASPDAFAFASEYKALLMLAGVGTAYDERRLFRFYAEPSRGLDESRETLFDGIRQLLPGECLTLDVDSLAYETERYYTPTPDFGLRDLDDAEAQARFRDLLTDSVRLRLRSDVPLGSCLSGGLDSGSIVCLTRGLIGDDAPYDTFSGRFPDSAADEWQWGEKIVEAAHTRAHTVAPRPEDLIERLADFVWLNELPVGSSSQYAQWCVFELAKREGVTVLLDGQGGDELLGGYEQYFAAYLQGLARRDPARAAAEEQAIRARYPQALLSTRQDLGRRLPGPLRHLAAGVLGRGSDFRFGLRRELADALEDGDAPAFALPDGTPPLTAALIRESFATNLPVLLRYGDRNSMAHSREVRLPFCDHRLAEFVFSLDPERLMGGAETKRLLRGAMRGILPEPVRERWNKQGFLPPQSDWFRGALGELAEEIVAAPEFRASSAWRAGWWQSVLRRTKAGEPGAADLLWRPVMDWAWRKHFLARAEGMEKLPMLAAGA